MKYISLLLFILLLCGCKQQELLNHLDQQQAKVIDLNDRVLNLDNPDDKMISAFANYAVQTENWQQNALQALTSDKKGLTPEKLLVLQDHVLNYNVEVSLVGTLARKIVAAVETLTRS